MLNYFYYDARGRRHAIEESTGLTYPTYDTDGLFPLLERDANGAVTEENTRGYSSIPGIGNCAWGGVVTPQGTYYQYDMSDAIGRVHRIVNGAGEVTGAFE